jgi:hypothetical protein
MVVGLAKNHPDWLLYARLSSLSGNRIRQGGSRIILLCLHSRYPHRVIAISEVSGD